MAHDRFGYEYLSPVPGAQRVSPFNNVVLRPGRPFQRAQLRLIDVEVVGDVSGPHAGTLSLSDDERTLVFEPETPYVLGERVAVRAGKTHGFGFGLIPPVEFDFVVSPIQPGDQARLAAQQSATDDPELAAALAAGDAPPPVGPDALVPSGAPAVTVVVSDHPAPGAVFLSPFSNNASALPGNLTILDDLGVPLFYRRLPQTSLDFKRQPDGRLTYFAALSGRTPRPQFMVLDSAYTVVDSFAAGNGYVTDGHEFQLLPDGHALVMIYDPQPVRMDSVVTGGRPDAYVTGLVLQELDREHRVIFQWRSWDWFEITDAASPLAGLLGFQIDWVHGNAIEVDHDGNLLVSCRHLSEITKIDRKSGAVIWRMGPRAKKNQFTFIGDPRGFSHQHDVRRAPNGNLTLFDNGNTVQPLRSRAVEYEIDEERRTARLVWEYRHTPDSYASFLGSVQRLPGGSTLIGWGGADSPGVSEVRPDGSVAWEIRFDIRGAHTYRAFRFPWQTTRFRTTPEALEFGAVEAGHSLVLPVTVANPGPDAITLNSYEVPSGSGFFVADADPRTLAAGESAEIHVGFHATTPGAAAATLTVAAVGADERIARQVRLTAAAVELVAAGDGPGTLTARGERSGGRPDDANAAVRPILQASIANPISGPTQVRFSLARSAQVALEIFGPRGRRVQTLHDGPMAAGDHLADWNPTGLASGIYFCRLIADGEAVTRKFAVLK